MTWLTWRQFRPQAWAALVALAVIAILFAATGPHLGHLYAASGIPSCRAHGNCDVLRTAFLKQFTSNTAYAAIFFVGLGVLYLAPPIIGMFWGAPLVTRELEAGTLRLAWNQSVTRTRWLALKLGLVGLVGLAAVATSGLFSLIVTWWASPVDSADALPGQGQALPNRFVPIIFGARDIVPIGYAVFGFVVGVTIGVLVRRTLPAMALTLAVVAAVQFAMPLAVRPHLLTPAGTVTALDASGDVPIEIHLLGSDYMTVGAPVNIPGAWIISTQTLDAAGHLFTGPPTQACLAMTTSDQACDASIDQLHLRQLVTYQPADRFWTFQWYETAILFVLALALAGLCVVLIRRLRPS